MRAAALPHLADLDVRRATLLTFASPHLGVRGHLPHLLAFALINGIAGQAAKEEFLSLAGPGFRDFSRIAAADPHMWRDVLVSNREELLAQSGHFKRSLEALEALISASDAAGLESQIEQASELRANWRMNAGKTSGR